MKYFDLDKEEEQLLKEFEAGEWKSIKNFAKAKRLYMQAAKNTLNKTKNINIRLSEKDLQKAKTKAAQTGIPYQTLLASVIHRFVNN